MEKSKFDVWFKTIYGLTTGERRYRKVAFNAWNAALRSDEEKGKSPDLAKKLCSVPDNYQVVIQKGYIFAYDTEKNLEIYGSDVSEETVIFRLSELVECLERRVENECK